MTDFQDAYISWLKSAYQTRQLNDHIEIITPFLNHNNDHMAIYAHQIDEIITLSDDGVVINELAMSGCDINTPSRHRVLNSILKGFGVKLEGEELIIQSSSQDFPQKKHMLLQAMLAVDDMFMLTRKTVTSVFLEDVAGFLDGYDIRYTPSVQFVGKSGFSQSMDFVIPKSKLSPERLIKAVNTPTRDNAKLVIFSWDDIRQVRSDDAQMYVFLNDNEKTISRGIMAALTEYQIKPILWSKREHAVKELVA